ncbi:MAG: Ig-like domain-containing protein [Rhodothermales bacterium]
MKHRLLNLLFALLFVAPLLPGALHAQMVVSVGGVSGAVGETVLVPVTLASVPGDGFSSFRFDVTISNDNLTFNGHQTDGSRTASGSGWAVGSNSSSAASNPGRVGGYSSASDAIAADGVLVFLSFTIEGTDGGAEVLLIGTQFSKGGTVAHTPETPSTQLLVSNPPVAQDDAYALDEGATLIVASGDGVLANDTDADGDALTVTLVQDVTNGALTLNADGSFEYIHDGSETVADQFSYTVSDGSNTDTGTVSLTINPVNDDPVFTAVAPDMVTDQNEGIAFDYDATDADGDLLEYAIVEGPGSIDPSSGMYLFSAEVPGTYTLSVSVSDGTVTVLAPVVSILVRQVNHYQATLSGLHLPSAVGGSSTGSVSVEHNVTEDVLSVSGTFSGLSSSFASAQIGVGAMGESGVAVLPLLAGFNDSTFRSGSFTTVSNTIDLGAASYPDGIDADSFKEALSSGTVFVVIQTIGNLDGELRGQLRPTDNSAPSQISLTAPSAVTTSGAPGDDLVSIAWTEMSTDAEGDLVKTFLEISGDIGFVDVLDFYDVTDTASMQLEFTTEWAAGLYDSITGREPGDILVGGTVSAFLRMTTTDGNKVAAGATHIMDITRASVTDTEDSELPSEFVLRGNYPNPFNPTTTISFDLPETADVQVDVLDLLGRSMMSIPSQSMSAGVNRTVSIDAADLTSGIYMYRVLVRGASNTWVKSGTMTLIK